MSFGERRNLGAARPFYGERMGERADLEGLIDAARGGDREAQGAVFDRYYGSIYRYAYARLGMVADAEDAAADTFAAALAALPRFRWRGAPFEAWLFRIAASKVADVGRRRRGDLILEGLVSAPAMVDAVDPARQADLAEERRRLMQAIERLPASQRDVLLLRFFLDMPIADVAHSLGRSPGAVKQLQLRGLRRLHEWLRR